MLIFRIEEFFFNTKSTKILLSSAGDLEEIQRCYASDEDSDGKEREEYIQKRKKFIRIPQVYVQISQFGLIFLN